MYNTTRSRTIKQVEMTGEAPNIQLTLVDYSGKLYQFHVKQILLCRGNKEIDKLKREQYVVYYKGKVEVICRFEAHTITKMFKYIPSSEKGFILFQQEDYDLGRRGFRLRHHRRSTATI